MTTQLLPKDRSLSKIVASMPGLDKACRTLLFSKFKDLKHGRLIIQDDAFGASEVFEFGIKDEKFDVTLIIKKPCFYSRTLFGGSIGNGESFVDGDWDCDHLPNLVRLFVLNRDLLESIDSGAGALLQPVQKLFHGLKANTLTGARENVKSHYDMGNDFFQLFLDSTMLYSCGLFKDKNTTLEDASLEKIATICRKLELKATDHLVEIGTGWGALSVYAAKNFGCQVTTTTISQEQFNFATELVKKEGLEQKVTVLFQDYRTLTGKFDKLVSVEMIEAVGLNYLGTYFEKCSSLLKPDGLMVLQAITIRDQFYANAKNSVDFIQRHIFPGTGIPSVHAMMNAITEQTDLIMTHQQDYAEDYAQTLHCWSERLTENKSQITRLGYPDFLYRLWQYYFAYCEGGFRERAIGLSQIILTKPLYRNRSLV